jgi:hypothetical protein
MEFMCVLSVGGSLATYRLKKESETMYLALLQNATANGADVPAEIILTKIDNAWTGSPQHEEIVRGLGHAIEAASIPADKEKGPAH